MVENSSGVYDATEMNVIHDGTDVYAVEYADIQLDTNLTSSSGSLGTYRAFIDSGLVKINFIPNTGGTLQSQTSTRTLHSIPLQ